MNNLLSRLTYFIATLFLIHSAYAADMPKIFDSIQWQEYSDTVLASANNEKLPILLFIEASWCQYCKKTINTTFKDKNIIDNINKSFTPIIVDIDQHTAIAKKYNVVALPTFVFLTNKMEVIKQESGYKNTEKMQTILTDVLAKSENKSSS